VAPFCTVDYASKSFASNFIEPETVGMGSMNVRELMQRLRVANPDATVLFLPWGADEDELEEIRAIAVYRDAWTHESGRFASNGYEVYYPGDVRGRCELGYEDVRATSVQVVVLCVDDEFLRTRRLGE
jgi:hypothetical protein